jgi:hypothetical protein
MAQYGVVEDPVQAQRKKILQEQLSHAWNSQVHLPPRPPLSSPALFYAVIFVA